MALPGAKNGAPTLAEKTGDHREFHEATASHAEGIGFVEEAKHASNSEKQMTLRKAIKLYPQAIGWSVLLSSTLIMEGTLRQPSKSDSSQLKAFSLPQVMTLRFWEVSMHLHNSTRNMARSTKLQASGQSLQHGSQAFPTVLVLVRSSDCSLLAGPQTNTGTK